MDPKQHDFDKNLLLHSFDKNDLTSFNFTFNRFHLYAQIIEHNTDEKHTIQDKFTYNI